MSKKYFFVKIYSQKMSAPKKNNNKIYKLIGHATDYDKFNKIHVMFLDKYDKEHDKDTLNTRAILERFDKMYKIDETDYSPLMDKYFVVKTDNKSYMINEGKTFKDCLQNTIIIEATPKKFDYPDKKGWYLKVCSIKIVESNK